MQTLLCSSAFASSHRASVDGMPLQPLPHHDRVTCVAGEQSSPAFTASPLDEFTTLVFHPRFNERVLGDRVILVGREITCAAPHEAPHAFRRMLDTRYPNATDSIVSDEAPKLSLSFFEIFLHLIRCQRFLCNPALNEADDVRPSVIDLVRPDREQFSCRARRSRRCGRLWLCLSE